MTDTIQPSPLEIIQEAQPEAVQLMSREQAAAEYHRMGPCYELNPEDAAPLLNLAATTLLEPKLGETAGELSARLNANLVSMAGIVANPSEKLEAVSMMSDIVLALGASPEQVVEYEYSNSLLRFVLSLQSSVCNDPLSTRAQKVDAFMGISTTKDELSKRGVQLVKISQTRTGERTRVADSEESWRVKALERVIEQRKKRPLPGEQKDDGVGDGKLFEIAVMASAQFKLWQNEGEDSNNFVRLANEREDKPRAGMPPNIGTRVAHDVVINRGDAVTRVQVKCGSGAAESADRYDFTVVTMAIDNTSDSKGFERMVADVIGAYKGDDGAIARLDSLLRRLGLLRFVS